MGDLILSLQYKSGIHSQASSNYPQCFGTTTRCYFGTTRCDLNKLCLSSSYRAGPRPADWHFETPLNNT